MTGYFVRGYVYRIGTSSYNDGKTGGRHFKQIELADKETFSLMTRVPYSCSAGLRRAEEVLGIFRKFASAEFLYFFTSCFQC